MLLAVLCMHIDFPWGSHELLSIGGHRQPLVGVGFVCVQGLRWGVVEHRMCSFSQYYYLMFYYININILVSKWGWAICAKAA